MSTNSPFDTRPEVDVIVYRHRADCRFTQKEKDGRCRCPKHLYVRLTRARISARRNRGKPPASGRRNGQTTMTLRFCANGPEKLG